MIDKEKIAALKELVAMLESEAPEGDAELEEEKTEEIVEPTEPKEEFKLEEKKEEEEDENDVIEEKKEDVEEEEKKESEDALPQKIFEMISDRDSLVQKVAPLIGKFEHSKMTAEQVAKYACDKLDIKSENPRAALDGYLKGYKHSKMYSIDAANAQVETTNSQLDKYLKGE